MAEYAVLCINEMRVALPRPFVEHVVRAVYLTLIPDTPAIRLDAAMLVLPLEKIAAVLTSLVNNSLASWRSI
jgi:hypothetical protein